MALSPYDAEFYARELARGRHREIVGGRWDETGRVQMAALCEAGLCPDHVLLDLGAGALRLGCKAVPYLNPGHYWGTDASRALMLAGYAAELEDKARLDPAQLVEDADFAFPGLPDTITHAIAFGVFAHLPAACLGQALAGLRRFPRLELFLFSVFLAPAAEAAQPFRQRDGVVTHPARPPYHRLQKDLHAEAAATGWTLAHDPRLLPRGQALFRARPVAG
jgi:hypothetical protein